MSCIGCPMSSAGSSTSLPGLDLLRHEAAPGVLLFLAAILALILDNSPVAWLYDGLFETQLTVGIGAVLIDKPRLLL